jgi:NADH-quinone oxidoreductase subunit L
MSDWIVPLVALAWLAPLFAAVSWLIAPMWTNHPRRFVPFVSIGAITVSLVASILTVIGWSNAGANAPRELFGHWYRLAMFGRMDFQVGYFVDSLALALVVVVSGVSLAVQVFAWGYLREETDETVEDHEVFHGTRSDGTNFDETGGETARLWNEEAHDEHHHGQHRHSPRGHEHRGHRRAGRMDRFYFFLSLFSWSMLGLVVSGNLLQLFVFWELVGACSYFLIGFYFERSEARIASTKAFVMNRVGDVGLLLGVAILGASLGTLDFRAGISAGEELSTPGLFDQVRGDDGAWRIDLAAEGGGEVVVLRDGSGGDLIDPRTGAHRTIPYALLALAGFCVVAGVMGKSAQVPLHTWLPDAMAGPTPVSALVHSATMVAAGVYLVARLSPLLVPEVLVFVAYVGAITLLLGAVLAMIADDIKRVLAFSTMSQLGYMLVALGVGGWTAGVFHLVTHAFFKSLLFLTAGSVILALHHVQDLKRMGGLARALPWTAATMLVGVIAISGLAVPLSERLFGEAIALSGYHSKDAILAAALAFVELNPRHTLVFALPALGAGLTSFYMFRLWLAVFAGPSRRDDDVPVRESPRVMLDPLVALALLAAVAGWGGEHGPLANWLHASAPLGAPGIDPELRTTPLLFPDAHAIEAVHRRAAAFGLTAAIAGAVLAWAAHRLRQPSAGESEGAASDWTARIPAPPVFDALYAQVFVQPALKLAAIVVDFDRYRLDGLLHRMATALLELARLDRRIDEKLIDGAVRLIGAAPPATGDVLRTVQTGSLRQYITFVVAGAALVALLGILAVGQ